jgi:flagellar capping protein FliD
MALSNTTGAASRGGTITFSGLASCTDTSSIVSRLIAIDAEPGQFMGGEITTEKGQVTAYNQLSTSISTLRSLMTEMKTASTFSESFAAFADSSFATACETGYVQAGTQTLTVSSLAQFQALVSESSAGSGYARSTSQNFLTGTITIANTSNQQDHCTVNIFERGLPSSAEKGSSGHCRHFQNLSFISPSVKRDSLCYLHNAYNSRRLLTYESQ